MDQTKHGVTALRFNNYPESNDVIHLIKTQVLTLHLFMNAVDMLGTT